MNTTAHLAEPQRIPRVLDGNGAVLWLESHLDSRLARQSDSRAAVAETLGRALSGLRAGALVDGSDAAGCRDSLAQATHRNVPMVVYVVATAPAAQAATDGTGHDSLHVLADSGCVVLVARNVQDVVDLGIAARRIAESLLQPVVVAMDREQTAESVQGVNLPDRDFLATHVGNAADVVPCTSFVHQLLFGEQRRRIPRWFDLERPVSIGSRQTGALWGRSVAARQAYAMSDIARTVHEQLDDTATRLARALPALSETSARRADTLLVAMGSVIEVAETACQHLRARKHKVGVLGVRCLRPLPTQTFLESLGKVRRVLVLESTCGTTLDEPPLARWVRTAIAQRGGRTMPQVHSVRIGMGGLPVRPADLVTLCLTEQHTSPTVVGIDFLAPTRFPKRQVLLDQLRREFPEAADRGVVAREPLDTREITIGDFSEHNELLPAIAALLQEVQDSPLRGRPARAAQHAPASLLSRLSVCSADVVDPGDAAALHVALVRDARLLEAPRWIGELAPEATVLLATTRPLEALPARPGITWFVTPVTGTAALLGALVAALRNRGVALPEDKRLLDTVRRSIAPPDDPDTWMASFENGLRSLQPLQSAAVAETKARAALTPRAVRDVTRTDTRVDSLPRFHDQFDVVHHQGDPAECSPDPYLALGVVPPSTTAFRDQSVGRTELPVVDTESCSGCGQCWLSCPDGALHANLVAPAELVSWAMARARDTGTPADALQMVSGKLNRRLSKDVAGAQGALSAAGLLRDAATAVIDASSVTDDRRQAMTEAVAAVTTAVEPLPLVRCADTLLSLAVDPGACKSCGLCSTICPEQAIARAVQTPDLVAAARRHADLHATLPAPQEEQVAAWRQATEASAVAALELGGSADAWMTGGDEAEPGSGARLAVRSVFSIASTQLAPHRTTQVQQIMELQEALAERIRTLLTQALPAGDLDVLAAGLDSFGDDNVELSALTARLEKATQGGQVDSARLGLYVDAARRIADVRWRLEQGINGFGTAPFSVLCVAGPATRWAARFPDNPFRVPVVVDEHGEAHALAMGLLAGQVARHAENVQEIRHARLALERPNEAALDGMRRHPLDWRGLTAEEKASCPPLLVIADEDALAPQQQRALMQLLDEELPVRLLLLAGLSLATKDPTMAVLSQHRSFVAQTSVSEPQHLLRVTQAAFSTSGSAWLRVHAPLPSTHGFPSDHTLERAHLAVASRALPLFCFDPSRPGVFGSRLDLDDNPQTHDTWASADETDTLCTFADWALGETRFATHLAPLSDADPAPLPLSEWLQLPVDERSGKTPFVEPSPDERRRRLRVRSALLRATEDRAEVWRILRELAGIETPFTDRIRQAADREAGEQFERDKRALESRHQAQLAAARSEVEELLVHKLEERLASLAGYAELIAEGED